MSNIEFLLQHSNFAHVPVNDILARLQIPLTMPGPNLRLFPHTHGTDGFYGAVLEKKPPPALSQNPAHGR